MSENLRIAVITHAIDQFENSNYLLNKLASHWSDRGIAIVILRGPDVTPPKADIAISHIDITQTTEEYSRLFGHYPLVINGNVLDISKSIISDQIVKRDSGFQGPVLVKTDMNFGGMRELKARIDSGQHNAAIDIQRPWRKVEFLQEYPIYESAGQVPSGVWRNPNLVVEKFRPEQNEEGQYVLRVWVFLGDREIYYQCVSDEPIIKSHNTIRRQDLDSSTLPPELREKRQQLGFDYGKFDFGLSDGKLVLYDVNRTPGSGGSGKPNPRAEKSIFNLSKGLDAFLTNITR
ncbi:MAG TPA: hypothetical protein VJ984_04790 [Xanthomonadales bacterium]|nr:hypothetical protein [Xanthomonadales bacterium]